MSSAASDLNASADARCFEHEVQCSGNLVAVRGDTEIRPPEVAVRPRRIPTSVEVQADVRHRVSPIWMYCSERRRCKRRSIGKNHCVVMLMHLDATMLMARVRTLGVLAVHGPVRAAVSADLDNVELHLPDANGTEAWATILAGVDREGSEYVSSLATPLTHA